MAVFERTYDDDIDRCNTYYRHTLKTELIHPCFSKDNDTIINTSRPRQNGRLFADDTFKRIFLNENIRISIKISLKFVPKGLINIIHVCPLATSP